MPTLDELLSLRAGAELDAAVCRAVGIEPHEYWMASDNGGKSSYATTLTMDIWRDRQALEEWLADRHRRGYLTKCKIVRGELWPRVSTDIAAAFEVLQKVAGHKHLSWRLSSHDSTGAPEEADVLCEIWSGNPVSGKFLAEGLGGKWDKQRDDWEEGNRVCLAICRAALAATEAMGEGR